MKASDLTPGDKFTINFDGKKRQMIKSNDTFIVCHYIPYDGYTVYVPKESEVEIVIEDETFTSNPDHKRNMM